MSTPQGQQIALPGAPKPLSLDPPAGSRLLAGTPEDKHRDNPKAVEIEIIGGIGRDVDASDKRREIKAVADDTPIHVNLHSGGGSVLDSYLIHNSLLAHPAPVSVTILGLAASAASWIPLAADPGMLSMHNTAQMMIHRARMGAFDTADGLQRGAEFLRALDGQSASLYATRTGIGQDEIMALMDAETWMTTEAAAKAGFVDTVIEGSAPSARLDLSRLGDIPDAVALAFGILPESEAPPVDPIVALLRGVESLPPEKVHAADPSVFALAAEALQNSQGAQA